MQDARQVFGYSRVGTVVGNRLACCQGSVVSLHVDMDRCVKYHCGLQSFGSEKDQAS
jgi:hypothetical protein